MNILLINLTRFGDLLQSQAAITDLAARGHRVGVVCLENFAGVATLLAGVEHLSALPSAGLLAVLGSDAASGGLSAENTSAGGGELSPQKWTRALADLTAWKRALQAAFPVDLVCNLTPTISARLLARFVAGDAPCAGFAVDEHGFGYSGNGWGAFLQGASAFRGVSPYNVVDLFRLLARDITGIATFSPATGTAAFPSVVEPATFSPATGTAASARPETLEGLQGPGMRAAFDKREMPAGNAGLRRPDEALIRRMREKLEAQAPAGCAGFVALQLGASNDVRRWPVSYFAALGERLWREERLCPVLLGSNQEQELAQRYGALTGQSGFASEADSSLTGQSGLTGKAGGASSGPAAASPSINLCGRTSLEDLAAALCCSKLLATNDTGTMHLAAGLNVPVLAVFLATAQPFDTGPYRAGNCSVEPDLACHPCSFGKACPNDHICRRTVQPDFLAELALAFLREGAWRLPRTGAGGAAASGGRVWIAAPDEDGLMNLVSLSGHEGEDRTQWLRLLRHGIRQFVDRNRAIAFRLIPAGEGIHFSERERQSLAADLKQAEGLITALVQQGRALLVHPLPPLKEKFLRSWGRVHTELARSPKLGALAVLWLEETQAEGQELPEILTVMEHFSALLQGLSGNI